MENQILGDYRIIKQIGHGSLGIVYLVEQRFIKKHYILKVLPHEFSQDRGFIQRFEEEVKLLAALEHPHIVKIHNVSFAEGMYFLVADCVVDSIGEATNLAQYMAARKGRLREEELLSLLRQVAEALDYAHSKSQGAIVHRTLKLNNILIGKGNPGIEVFLSDYGLSKIIGPGAVVCRSFKAMADSLGKIPFESSEKTGEERYQPIPIEVGKLSKLTQSFLQNFAFMAPEQKQLGPVGPAADVYAFGVLAYYLISGCFPEGIFDMPSIWAPEYAYDWNWLVASCLQSKPEKRPVHLLPLLGKKPALQRQAFEQKKETPSLEPVKSELMAQAKMELKPVIKPQELAPPPKQEEALSFASCEGKDVAEATASVPSFEKQNAYSQHIPAMLQREPVVTHYQPEKKESKMIEPIPTEMIVIQGGQFPRGSNGGSRDEMPRHLVYLDSFAMDIHAVTNEQFVRFLEYMGGEKDQNYNDLIRLKDSRINRFGGKISIESGYAKHPVVGVTWYGAVAYAKWVGKRLPTEAEWEIAARGGLEHFLYSTGDTIEKSQANFFSSDTTGVMSYAPNGYGLYDMAGNVYEWCQDWYGYNYYEHSVQEPHNPKGPLQGVYRVLRGGCWKSLKEDLRCSHRHRNNPGALNGTYGFRCSADANPT